MICKFLVEGEYLHVAFWGLQNRIAYRRYKMNHHLVPAHLEIPTDGTCVFWYDEIFSRWNIQTGPTRTPFFVSNGECGDYHDL